MAEESHINSLNNRDYSGIEYLLGEIVALWEMDIYNLHGREDLLIRSKEALEELKYDHPR